MAHINVDNVAAEGLTDLLLEHASSLVLSTKRCKNEKCVCVCVSGRGQLSQNSCKAGLANPKPIISASALLKRLDTLDRDRLKYTLDCL